MILTKKQLKEFEEASRPLMKFLCDNFNPHVVVIVTPTDSEILSASARIKCYDFVKYDSTITSKTELNGGG